MKKFRGIQFTCIDELNVDSPNYRKPSMKGGHTHNHIYNKCNKHLFRGRRRRKIDRKNKPEFVRTFLLNIELGNVTMDSLMHTIFHHNKKEYK